ncbi:MAG: hypothetical protein QOI48_1363 [Solirubrobacteraceae bacterium]|nr:hypothetical protein [Solirubrobacteraceae bacterium]
MAYGQRGALAIAAARDCSGRGVVGDLSASAGRASARQHELPAIGRAILSGREARDGEPGRRSCRASWHARGAARSRASAAGAVRLTVSQALATVGGVERSDHSWRTRVRLRHLTSSAATSLRAASPPREAADRRTLPDPREHLLGRWLMGQSRQLARSRWLGSHASRRQGRSPGGPASVDCERLSGDEGGGV